MNAPTRIIILAKGKEPPEWVVECMLGNAAADGTLNIETVDGPTLVKPGEAIFELNGEIYACAPRLIPDRIKGISGGEHDQMPASSPPESLVARSADKPLKLKPQVGTPPAPQFALIESLKVDDTYQRSIEGGASRRLIVKIAENWDWRLCLPLLVSRRDGMLFVIDGQHRKEAAELRGDIRQLPVVVFDFNSREEEAELFVAANRSRRPMSQLDDFHAAVAAGDKKAAAVNEVVTASGLSVGRIQAWQYWKPGEVVFVRAIQSALHSAGRAVVERSLSLIAQAFDGLVLTGAGALFTGLCSLLQKRDAEGKPIDPALMSIVLAEVGIPGWKEAMERAESGPDRAEMMLAALAAAYAEAEAE